MTIETKYKRGSVFWTVWQKVMPAGGPCIHCGRSMGFKYEPAIPRKHKVESIDIHVPRFKGNPDVHYNTDFGSVAEQDAMTKIEAQRECDRLNQEAKL